jgi:NTE family protein
MRSRGSALTRALVLGGGGVTGIAWEAGVLHGLAETGFDIRNWDMVVGTSAGAVVGAKLLGEPDFEAWFATQLIDDTSTDDEIVVVLAGRIGARCIFAGRRRRLGWLPRVWLTAYTAETFVRHAVRRRSRPVRPSEEGARPREISGPNPMLARAASLAVVARTAAEARFVEVIAAALEPVREWPKGLVVAAIAQDGSTVVFDERTGVELPRAVAASTAVPLLFPPIVVDGRVYIDGGMASQTNAGAAAGSDEILVVAPINTGALGTEITDLQAAGARVDIVRPGEAAGRALGRHLELLDPARRSLAARAGIEDGLRAGRELAPRSSRSVPRSAA